MTGIHRNMAEHMLVVFLGSFALTCAALCPSWCIQIQDLYERRVDAWIMDYPDATHVLDVYRGKRIDKRHVFVGGSSMLMAGSARPVSMGNGDGHGGDMEGGGPALIRTGTCTSRWSGGCQVPSQGTMNRYGTTLNGEMRWKVLCDLVKDIKLNAYRSSK